MAEYRKTAGKSEQETASAKGVSILVYIHGTDSGGIYGRLVNFCLKDPVEFAGSGDLVLKLDEICSRLEEMEPSLDDLLDRHGSLAYPDALQAKTLLTIDVDSRRHFSMQGRVCGRQTEGRLVSYRSALELLRILNKITV